MKRFILIILIILLFSISIYTVTNYNKSKAVPFQSSNNNETKAKIKATDFKLKDLNEKEISLADYKGKKVFLNFWASWCPPCKAEMPDLEKLYQETKDSDLVILAINLGEDREIVKSFIDNNKYNFTILLDSNEDIAAKYNVASIPTSLFIDKDGNIISKRIGAMSIEEMKSYVNSLDSN